MIVVILATSNSQKTIVEIFYLQLAWLFLNFPLSLESKISNDKFRFGFGLKVCSLMLSHFLLITDTHLLICYCFVISVDNAKATCFQLCYFLYRFL